MLIIIIFVVKSWSSWTWSLGLHAGLINNCTLVILRVSPWFRCALWWRWCAYFRTAGQSMFDVWRFGWVKVHLALAVGLVDENWNKVLSPTEHATACFVAQTVREDNISIRSQSLQYDCKQYLQQLYTQYSVADTDDKVKRHVPKKLLK